MDEQLIGKIVLTIAVGTPTAYWIGRIFADIMKGRLIHWANEAGYERGFNDGWAYGYKLAVNDGKKEAADQVAKRIMPKLISVIELEGIGTNSFVKPKE